MKTCSFNVSDKRKDKITAKFQSTKRVPIEHTKRFLSPEKFRDFRETGPRFQFFFRAPVSLTGINTCLDEME